MDGPTHQRALLDAGRSATSNSISSPPEKIISCLYIGIDDDPMIPRDDVSTSEMEQSPPRNDKRAGTIMNVPEKANCGSQPSTAKS